MGHVISIVKELQDREATANAERKLLDLLGELEVEELLQLPEVKRQMIYYLIGSEDLSNDDQLEEIRQEVESSMENDGLENK